MDGISCINQYYKSFPSLQEKYQILKTGENAQNILMTLYCSYILSARIIILMLDQSEQLIYIDSGINNPMIKEKQTVNRTGMVFNKSYGQHILINSHILNEMVVKSAIRPTDVVLEIGPGTGNLTALLLQRAKKVIAIEIDPRMVAQLSKRFKYSENANKFVLVPGDVLQIQLPFFDVCVANIPYQISSPLVFKLLSQKPMFRCAVLMFQKEFAQRLTAKPGSDLYCRLSVNVQLLSKVDHLIKVGKNNFKPPPKVESSIVRIEPKNPLPDIDFLEWDGLLRICFIRKNKTLQAAFKNKKTLEMLKTNSERYNANYDDKKMIELLGKVDLGMEEKEEDMEDDDGEKMEEQEDKNKQMKEFKDKIINILEDLDYNKQRPSKLGLEDFLKLLYNFNKNNIHFR